MDLEARGFEDRPQRRAGRAFAVGARDVEDRRQAAFGMAEPFQQRAHPVEREVDRLRVKAHQPFEDRVAGGRAHCAACASPSG